MEYDGKQVVVQGKCSLKFVCKNFIKQWMFLTAGAHT